MKTTVRTGLVHLCPYGPEVDVGAVTIVWDGPAPELHGLAGHLSAFVGVKITHEDVTQRIADWARASVTTTWTTAGLEVEVHAVSSDEPV